MPTMQGMPRVRARMTEWEVEEPSLVTKPATLFLSSRTVWLGSRSSAATITGSSGYSAASGMPLSTRTSRLPTSVMSAERACMYSSSMALNMAARPSAVCRTAYSALKPWSSSSSMPSMRSGSSSIMRWISNTWATFSSVARAFSYRPSSSRIAWAAACS